MGNLFSCRIDCCCTVKDKEREFKSEDFYYQDCSFLSANQDEPETQKFKDLIDLEDL